jgi:outer membrane immunogenic protein
MRGVLFGLAGLLVAIQAHAADYLRGSVYEAPPPPAEEYNWAGIYAGGQAGLTSANYGFKDASRDLVARMLRNTTIEKEAAISELADLPGKDTRAGSYGAFFGYNTQWGKAVLGLELNYNRTSQGATSTDSIGRAFTTSDGYTYNVFVNSTASMKLIDYGTLRGRFGYAWGWVMPYAMLGVAAARADISRNVSVDMTFFDATGQGRPGGSFSDGVSDVKNNQILLGYMTGIGVDVGLMPGVFVRAEYEFIQLGQINGIGAQISTARVAAALKF